MGDNEASHEKAWPIVGTTPEDVADNEVPHEKAWHIVRKHTSRHG